MLPVFRMMWHLDNWFNVLKNCFIWHFRHGGIMLRSTLVSWGPEMGFWGSVPQTDPFLGLTLLQPRDTAVVPGGTRGMTQQSWWTPLLGHLLSLCCHQNKYMPTWHCRAACFPKDLPRRCYTGVWLGRALLLGTWSHGWKPNLEKKPKHSTCVFSSCCRSRRQGQEGMLVFRAVLWPWG